MSSHQIVTFLLSLLALSAPALADVVRVETDGNAMILYRSGAFIERGSCTESATIRRRTTCTRDPRRMDAVAFYDFLLRSISIDLPEVDQAMSETQANLTETDNKLQEFLASDPQTPANEHALEEIARAQTDAAEAGIEVEGLKEQIARIKALPDYRTNPDLPRQLATLEGQLTEAKRYRDDKVTELNALRARYVADHSAGHSQAAFQVLVRQRETQAGQYTSLRRQSQEILAQLTSMNQFIGEIIEDQSFAYEIRQGVPFTTETWTAFNQFPEAYKASGVIFGDMTERGIEVVVPHMTGFDEQGHFADYDSKIQWMRCKFIPHGIGATRCTHLSVMNLSDEPRGGIVPNWNLPLAFDLAKDDAPDGLEAFARRAFGWDASGNWVYTPACNQTVTDRRVLGRGWCELGFRYERVD